MNNKEKRTLKPSEMTRLEAVRKRPAVKEGDSSAEGPFLILESTQNQLLKELNISLIQLMSMGSTLDDQDAQPINQLTAMTGRILKYLERNGDVSAIFRQMNTWAKAVSGDPAIINALAQGTAITLRAYQIQSGNTFLDQLMKMSDETLVKEFKKQDSSKPKTETTIFDEVIDSTGLPNDQVNLRNAIDTIADFCPSDSIKPYIKHGATVMFNVIEGVWNEIYPTKTARKSP